MLAVLVYGFQVTVVEHLAAVSQKGQDRVT